MAAPNIPADMHRSERLVYRAWEDPDVEHVFAWMQDPVTLTKSSVRAPYPRSKKELAEHWAERAPAALLCAVICLPSSSSSPSDPQPITNAGTPIALPGTPIGVIDFSPPFRVGRAQPLHHPLRPHQRLLPAPWVRHGSGGVDPRAGVFEAGDAPRGRRGMGFVLEGTNRKALFREGKFWDTINMGILEEDWFALQEKKKAAAGVSDSQTEAAVGASPQTAAGASQT
ncbi:hypothetical protein PLICRDRAFT_176686 [Plicaturopsis crispa FD-325 SS-3]|nr:hypothetical protein PLICRDRAFT_176686 [Plicaturopsis crispa FD-325 SS-3]